MKYRYDNQAGTRVLDTDTGLCLPVLGGAGEEYYALRAWLASGNTPDAYVPPPAPEIYTKLAIRRAMRSLGIEAQLDALLDSSTLFRADWTDATEIDLSDPVLLQALAGASIDVAAVKAELNK